MIHDKRPSEISGCELVIETILKNGSPQDREITSTLRATQIAGCVNGHEHDGH